ncbi:hypothetical protein Glove_9g21 [Diversispora epigaea]|uniref:Uncharacterized protein n=1 Tax=Diversispora epigaea TaxID=1348612 RepID=A0A397JRH2_9GLOM|nr:hypothetical protein Glove_9g21 [Diversispora epigaea]
MFTSAPSKFRYRSVKPIHLLTEIDDNNNDDELLYWDDAIDKYFDRPDHPNFHLITYPNYFRDYTIQFKQSSQNSNLFYCRDRKNRIIVQRKTPILLRFTTYKIEDGEPFFFQHLIMKIPVRSEQELLGEFETYKDRFQTMFPTRYNQVTESLRKNYIEQRNCISESYKSILTTLLHNFQNQDLSDLMFNQFLSLKKHCPQHRLPILTNSRYRTIQNLLYTI